MGVDENAARRLWPDIPDPVGRMLKLGRKDSAAPWIRVVGVAQAIEYEARRQIDILESGGVIRQETRLFDSRNGSSCLKTSSVRSLIS